MANVLKQLKAYKKDANKQMAAALKGGRTQQQTFSASASQPKPGSLADYLAQVDKPTMASGSELASNYGINNNYDDILGKLKQGVDVERQATNDLNNKTLTSYYQGQQNQQANYLSAMRRANQGAIANGMSKGLSGVQQLMASQQLSQTANNGLTNTLKENATRSANIAAKEGATYGNAINTANAAGAQLGQIAGTKYTADAGLSAAQTAAASQGYEADQNRYTAENVAKTNLKGTKYSADKSLESYKYTADTNYKGVRDTNKTNKTMNKADNKAKKYVAKKEAKTAKTTAKISADATTRAAGIAAAGNTKAAKITATGNIKAAGKNSGDNSKGYMKYLKKTFGPEVAKMIASGGFDQVVGHLEGKDKQDFIDMFLDDSNKSDKKLKLLPGASAFLERTKHANN